MSRRMPLVSIVIPAYNHGNYLHEAIKSVLTQTYSNIELLVLDDGSTDNTSEILFSYGNKFYWECHENMGQSATLNKGWKLSKGDIISYLSADDALKPNAVELAVRSLQKHAGKVLVYGDYELIDANSKIIKWVKAPEFNYSEMVTDIVVQPGPGVFFRRGGFEKIGGWNSKLRQVPDYDYWLRLGLLGGFKRIPELLASYRVHETSQSFAEPNIERSEECVHVIYEYFEKNTIPNDIMVLEKKSKGMAYLIASRFHLRAGRYGFMLISLKRAWAQDMSLFFTFRIIRLLGNAVLFRIKRIFSV